MKGIVRPCRHRLGEELHARWQAHLCGLCLTLRDEAGQAERALTGYDVLLLSVLVEAQAGPQPTTQAGPCPLRACRPAQVVAASTGAAQLAAASALLLGGAGLDDKLGDGEVPRGARRAAASAAARLDSTGRGLAARVGLDPVPLLATTAAAQQVEADATSDLDALLAPSGAVVARLFAHTAVVAGVPENAPALHRAGDAFGRLVHLLDAVEDHGADLRAGRANPLAATATPPERARALALALAQQVQDGLDACTLVDPELARHLLGAEVRAAVDRALPEVRTVVPAPRTASPASLVALWSALLPAVIIWSSGGGGGCGPRRRPHYGPRYGRRYTHDPYGGYGYGYGPAVHRGGCCTPGCGQLLACNCCANVACNACCCGDCGDV